MLKHLLILLLILIGLSSIATIRKDEDPVRKTQTDPILYKQKMEEQKDGVKGAPSPSFKFYNREGFLADSPVDQKKEEAAELPKTVDSTEVNLEEPLDAHQEASPDSLKEGQEDEDWWDSSGKEEPAGDQNALQSEETAPDVK